VIWGESGREKTNPTKRGTRPPLTTDREGFREDGEGVIWGESGQEKTQPDQRGPDPSKSLSDFISKDGHGVAQYM